MILSSAASLCHKNQKIITSSEKGRTHTAINPDGKFDLRHFRLDGVLIKNQLCCDFLLVNDTGKKAYYIELKGQNIQKAVEQVLAAERLCSAELKGYLSYFRIIPSKAKTQELQSTVYRRLLSRVGSSRLICKSVQMTETQN